MTEVVRGLSPEDVRRVLVSPKFITHLGELAAFTRRTRAEGGMAVYKSYETGRLSVSPVDVQDEAELQREQNDRYWNGQGGTARYSYSSKRLYVKSGKRRTDLGLFIHSHPVEEYEDPEQMLVPSLGDLGHHEDLGAYNPNLIEGILVPADQQNKLLLYRESSTRPLSPYWHGRMHSLKADHERAAMHDSGIDSVVVDYDRQSGTLLSDPAAVCDQLLT